MKKRFKKVFALMLVFTVFIIACGESDPINYDKAISKAMVTHGDTDGDVDAPFPSPTQTSEAVTVLPSVKKLSVKKAIQSKVMLSWDSVSEAKEYRILRSNNKNTGFKQIATVAGLSYTDKTAKKRKTVYYRVVCSDGERESSPSNTVKTYVYPKHPKTVFIGECFVVALEKEKKRFPNYYHYIGKAGMNVESILTDSTFHYKGQNVTPLEKAALMKADRIIFICGVNYSGSCNPKKSAKKFKKMLKLMKKINPNIQMVVMAVSPWKKNSEYGRKLPSHTKRHEINAAYRNVAKESKNIYYCALTLRLENQYYDLKEEYNGGDGLHWSGLARERMSKWIKKWCKKKLHTA